MDGQADQVGIELRLLGGLDVRRNGRALAFPTRHCGLLLAILSLAPNRTMSREALASLLWSDRGEAQAMASLRQTLYHLRKTLGDIDPPVLDADRRQVRVCGIRSDVDAVRDAIDTNPSAVIELYGGALLFGSGQVDPAFDEWLRMEQAVLSETVSDALRAYAVRCAGSGQREEACRAAAALLRLDPLDEAAARLQMTALAEMGQRAAALSLCDDLAKRLRDELGVDPDAATQDLRDRVALWEREPQSRPDDTPTDSAAFRRRISERRVVTLVALAARDLSRDPEAFADELVALGGRIAKALVGTSGQLIGPVGQILLVIFGPSEGHAVDAVSFAWQLGLENSDLGIGVMSGTAILVEKDGDMVLESEGAGPLVAAASAMATTAGPGETLVSRDVEVAASGYFEFAPRPGSSRVIARTSALNRWEAWQNRPTAPFVGRENEMAELRRMLDLASSGEGRVVALIGEAGIGKSRLVHEFLRTSPAQRCFEFRMTLTARTQARPFGPLPHFLSDWQERYSPDELDADSRQALEALLGNKHRADWAALEAGDRRRRIMDLARAVIARACADGPLILVVEDMHWIDGETEALLDDIVLDLHSAPILLVATYRPEYQSRWVGRSIFELIRIRPLTHLAVEQLIAGLGGDPGVLQAQVTNAAGGIPLFIEELVRTHLAEPSSSGTPATIADVIAARVAQMGAAARRLLLTASVLGMETSPRILARISELDEAEFGSALDELLASELLVRAGSVASRSILFRHALIHDVAYDALLKRDRRSLHRRALDLLSGEGPDPATLAYHAEACEDWDAAARWYCSAGDVFAEITACSQARDAYLKALEAERRREAPNPRTELDLHLRLRPVLVPLGDYVQAREHLDAAEELLTSVEDPPLATAVHISKSYLFSTHGAIDEAVASAKRAAAMSTGRRQQSAEARLALGQALSLRGDVLGARAALEPALPFYEVHPLERFSQTGTRSIWCHGHMAHANCLSGDLERAKTHADRAVTLAEETGRPLDKVFSMHCHGEVLLECESYAAAAEILEEAMGIAEHVNSPLFTVWLGCDIIPAYIALGRIEPARQILARQEPEARRLSLHQFAACLALRRGEIALVDGREDEAAKQAEAALLTARSAGYFVIETAALRVGGSIERFRGETTSTLEAAAALAETRGLAGEVRRARASVALPYGAPGTI